ncbi:MULTISPECIES: DUF6783 domain-containing protein [Blautia]
MPAKWGVHLAESLFQTCSSVSDVLSCTHLSSC